MSESDALAWWPYRPLYRVAWTPDAQPRNERMLATSRRGGTAGPASARTSALIIMYERPGGVTAENASFDELLEAGGIALQVSHWPGSGPPPTPQPEDIAARLNSRARPITIMDGTAAKFMTVLRPLSNVDRHIVSWFEDAGRGTYLHWTLVTNPRRFSADATTAIADRLEAR